MKPAEMHESKSGNNLRRFLSADYGLHAGSTVIRCCLGANASRYDTSLPGSRIVLSSGCSSRRMVSNECRMSKPGYCQMKTRKGSKAGIEFHRPSLGATPPIPPHGLFPNQIGLP
jgi:hypothetical protein